ncbi:hypothetical protein ACPV4O_14505 [Vibrio owensii]|uniref:hypothetical protein n=1 Tax=Vibrio owensii TaxID=696485 RepID=UPI0040696E9A
MIELLTGGYLYKHQNILVTGPTGTGKTYTGYAFEPVPAINRNHLTLPTDFIEHSTVERLDGNAQKQL